MKTNNFIRIVMSNVIAMCVLLFSCGAPQSSYNSSDINMTETYPRIEVRQLSSLIYSGSGPYPFGNVAHGNSSNPVEFTIDNSGGGELIITGIEITGTNDADFSHDFSGEQTIIPGGSLTFHVTFTPTTSTLGSRYAQLNIAHNDFSSTENPFVIKLTGSTTKEVPEINVRDNANNTLLSNSLKNFGSVYVGSNTSLAFTIENIGSADLTLTGSAPNYATSSSAEFIVTLQPSSTIAPSARSIFTVQFVPLSAGYKTATLTITSDDSDEGAYQVSVSGTGLDPALIAQEINIKQGGTNLPHGLSSISYGDIAIAAGTVVKTYTIQNVGNADLDVTSIVSSDAQFAVNNLLDSSATPIALNYLVAPSDYITFDVTFDPSLEGPQTATITVGSDDSDEPAYTFNVTGTGTAVPEFDITGPAAIANGGSHDFGNTSVGVTNDDVFTITNNGGGTLSLTGSPRVLVVGSTDFSVTAQPGASINAGLFDMFTVRFNPSSVGLKTATVIIANNDSDEGTFAFTVYGNGTVNPEFDITAPAAIANGGSHDFGNTGVGVPRDIIFTITNNGGSTLNLTGSPRVVVVGSPDFFVTAQPGASINAGLFDVFTVRFNPSSEGLKTATVIIANDDSDEGTFAFTVYGNGTVNPEFDITGPAAIANGGSHDFGNTGVGVPHDVIFTITNNGGSTLNLTGSPRVVVVGSPDFSVTAQPGASINAGLFDMFTVRFNPSSVGLKTATVIIANDDSDKGTFAFTVYGNGTVNPEFDITAPAAIANGGSHDFGNTGVGVPRDIIFTITNNGGSTLNLTGSPRVVVVGSPDFSVTAQPGASINAGLFDMFTISFNPSSVGLKTATVIIANDDSDEGLFVFTVYGNGI